MMTLSDPKASPSRNDLPIKIVLSNTPRSQKQKRLVRIVYNSATKPHYLFILNLLLKYDLDPAYNYEYKGIISEKLKAAIFSLSEDNLTRKNVRIVAKAQ